MQKLGMKPVPGIIRVTVKKSKTVCTSATLISDHCKQILFVISKPDVYKSPSSDTYIIFGEAKIEDLSSNPAINAARQFERPTGEVKGEEEVPELVEPGAAPPKKEAVEESTEAVDETGLEPKDIELVMAQAGVKRAAAVKALRKTDGDIVNAIMVCVDDEGVNFAQELTMS